MNRRWGLLRPGPAGATHVAVHPLDAELLAHVEVDLLRDRLASGSR